MTETALRWITAAGVVLGLGGQALLQEPLGHRNEIRDVRNLHMTPSSLAFRLAAGGVKEAAADALWLATLPRLGRTWVDPERKARWIESTAAVMIDANPRALNPTIYAATFLEMLRLDEPGVDSVLLRAMYAEQREPFGERVAVNADSWRLPHQLMMNRYQQYVGIGRETALAEAIAWGEVAAKKPDCPLIIADFVAALRARRGEELAGWLLYLDLHASTPYVLYKDDYLEEANNLRRRAMMNWAREFEKEEKRFPASLDEALRYALPATRNALRLNPELNALFRDGVSFDPATRDIVIPEWIEKVEADQRLRLKDYARVYELENGRAPEDLAEVASIGPIPVPPRHGTKWGFDPETKTWSVVEAPNDPRTFSDWR